MDIHLCEVIEMTAAIGPGADEEDPYEGETHVRMLDPSPRNVPAGTCHAITEKGLHLVRVRQGGAASNEAGARLKIAESVNSILGPVRHRDLSPRSHSQLSDSITAIIKENPEVYLGFYNRAGPVSLKMHAFQLLPGIGQSTAQQMVKARGREGWTDLDAVSADCDIDAAAALAGRLAEEMQDPAARPSLLELLVRAA